MFFEGINRETRLMKKANTFSKTRIAVTSLAIGMVVAGVMYLRHSWIPYHLLTVTPNVLYRSGCLSHNQLERVVDQYDIQTIVALELASENDPVQDWYNQEVQLCKEKGIQFVYLPVEANARPESSQIEEWLRLFDHPENQPILVHCAQGVSRTGLFVAVYQMEFLGKENHEALSGLPMFSHQMNEERRGPMIDFILQYEPRWKRGPLTQVSRRDP
jgi:protein tyrosine phosphatase